MQYRESDFDFVSRLMQHFGICYFFKHEKDKHVLVLADNASAHPNCGTQHEFAYLRDARHASDNKSLVSSRTCACDSGCALAR